MSDIGVSEASPYSPGKKSSRFKGPHPTPKTEEDRKGITRRQFLSGIAGLAGTAILAKAGLLNASLESPEQPKKIPAVAPIENPLPTPKVEKTPIPYDYLNEILSLPLKSPQRIQKETEYVKQIEQTQSLQLIDQGFWVLSDINQRAHLLDLRYKLRTRENSKLIKLSQQQLNWVMEKGIHPEVLGICLDAENKAKGVIGALLAKNGGGVEKFRPDLVRLKQFNHPQAVDLTTVTIPGMMINPGGMSQLVCYETGLALNQQNTTGLDFNNSIYGFSFIGGKQAVTEINLNVFPTDIPALKELCTLLKNDTSLNFIPENIPGSEWGNRNVNISGGAIGLQFMPNKALELYRLFDQVNIKFNPFDLESALIGAWVFLAKGELVGNTEVRYGYLKGDKAKIIAAITKWNPFPDQINKIYNTAVDYYNRFGG